MIGEREDPCEDFCKRICAGNFIRLIICFRIDEFRSKERAFVFSSAERNNSKDLRSRDTRDELLYICKGWRRASPRTNLDDLDGDVSQNSRARMHGTKERARRFGSTCCVICTRGMIMRGHVRSIILSLLNVKNVKKGEKRTHTHTHRHTTSYAFVKVQAFSLSSEKN